MLTNSNRTIYVDQIINSDCEKENYSNVLFTRLIAKERRFFKVDFKYTVFDSSYLRKCIFEECDFTGCRFISTNLVGSSFPGSKFDYAIFERTYIDNDVLNNGCPGMENLTQKFARTLRINYQQIGDTISTNKAIKVELAATKVFLYKSWASNESYYRKKYKGFSRAKMFIEWFGFKFLDIVWGNGESTIRLIRTILSIIVLLSVYDYFCITATGKTFLDSFYDALALFLGAYSLATYPKIILALIAFLRLVFMGFFMSIIIKRFNRR